VPRQRDVPQRSARGARAHQTRSPRRALCEQEGESRTRTRARRAQEAGQTGDPGRGLTELYTRRRRRQSCTGSHTMAEEESSPAPRRRGRPAGGANSARSASTTRRRRIGGAELVETLNEMVSQLIKENRSLKRQL